MAKKQNQVAAKPADPPEAKPKPLDLSELAASILAEAVIPTLEQVKALAQAVVGGMKAAKAKKGKLAKPAKPKAGKKAEKSAAKDKDKAAKGDPSGKKRKARLERAEPKLPKIKLPKPKKAKG